MFKDIDNYIKYHTAKVAEVFGTAKFMGQIFNGHDNNEVKERLASAKVRNMEREDGQFRVVVGSFG